MNIIESLATFLNGSTDAKVSIGIDTSTIIKAGVIVILTVAISVFLTKMLK